MRVVATVRRARAAPAVAQIRATLISKRSDEQTDT